MAEKTYKCADCKLRAKSLFDMPSCIFLSYPKHAGTTFKKNFRKVVSVSALRADWEQRSVGL